MGVSTIDEVLPKVKAEPLRTALEESRRKHGELGNDTHALLREHGDTGKEPAPMAKAMSWMKTNVMLSVNQKDAVIADLVTDGCNMGVKSLNKYLNQFQAADERSKDIAKRLIALETTLSDEMRPYL